MGRFIDELLNALSAIDTYNQYIVYTTDFGREQLALGKNFSVHSPKLSRPLRLVWEQVVLPSLVHKHRADLLHGQGFTLPIIKNCRQVVTMYDMTWFSHRQTHERVKSLYFRTLIPIALRRANRIVAISESAKADTERLFPETVGKVITTPGGVAACFFMQHPPSDTKIVLAKYGIDGPFILSVGMIQPRKNLPRLLEAFAQLKKDGSLPHRLVVCGEAGWDNDAVFRRVEAPDLGDHVVFTGFVPDEDLVHLYRGCDVFAYPSLYEGFGLPVVEAMAAGAAVLTSDNSSLREVAGDAALLCDPLLVDDIADKLRLLATDPKVRATFVSRGHQRAPLYTWKETAQRTLEAYQQAL